MTTSIRYVITDDLGDEWVVAIEANADGDPVYAEIVRGTEVDVRWVCERLRAMGEWDAYLDAVQDARAIDREAARADAALDEYKDRGIG